MDSILTSIKLLLGITEEYDAFDGQLIMFINSAFANLFQLGVGPAQPFKITDKSDTWSNFTENNDEIENVRTYVFIKTRMMFDPPTSTVVMECLKASLAEQEWRLRETCESQKE